MTRRKLEEYAVAAAETLERLENENSQLRRDIQLAQVVDMDVIKGWQRWSQIADEEREKWADTATRLTGENEHLKGFMDLVERASGGILVALTDIGTMASEESEEGTNQKAMRKGLKKITQLAKEARQAYDEYFQEGADPNEEPALEPDEDPQLPDSEEVEEENHQDEQVATDAQ